MKIGPVTKIDKKNKKPLNKSDHDVCCKIMSSLPSFQPKVILEQSGSRIPDA